MACGKITKFDLYREEIEVPLGVVVKRKKVEVLHKTTKRLKTKL
jgi:hypothetical protein